MVQRSTHVAADLGRLLESSRLLSELDRVRRSPAQWAFEEAIEPRPLSRSEVEQLLAQGNTAEDWRNVLVHPAFDPGRVWQCRFLGTVVLAPFRGTIQVRDLRLPTGVYRCTLRDAVVGCDALVQDTALIDHALFGPRSAVVGAGFVLGKPSTCGNGVAIHLGVTTGGRSVVLYAECLFEEIVAAARRRIDVEQWERIVRRYADGCALGYTVVGPEARVLGVGRISACYLDRGVQVDGAAELDEVTILADERATRVGTRAIVRRSIVQWGADVSDGALVEDAFVCEGAKVTRYARVRHSVIGPNTTCAQAEVTSSLVGPFTGINHDALLIAALWEGGRGNLSAGARVGSNHTGKAPDQELHAGEGVFFGLGVLVKYPANFSRAPYTLIASGATLLPQELRFPFSLIVPPRTRSDGVAEGYNQLYPGWLLYAAPYAVVRNELKFATRNRCRHNTLLSDVLRFDTVQLMVEARRRLQTLLDRGGEFFTDADDVGLGKNFVTADACRVAVQAYGDWARLWVLRQVWRHVAAANGDEIEGVFELEPVRWGEKEELLVANRSGVEQLEEWLSELVRLENELAVAVEQSKSRDYRRAVRLLPDYESLVPMPHEDSVVRACWERARELEASVAAFLDRVRTS